MSGKTIAIILVAILALYAGGCLDRGDDVQTAPAINSQACYSDAQAKHSSHLVAYNKLDRAVAILTVINVCEGN